MLRRLPLGFTGLIAAATLVSACSSSSVTTPVNVGPTFASQTLYATNATQNGISIYPAQTKSGSGPQYQIGGSSTTLAGPQYITFDALSDIFTTNWTPATDAASIVEFKATATGNVLPIDTYTFTTTQPRGIFGFQTTFAGATTASNVLVVAVTSGAQSLPYISQLQFFTSSLLSAPYQTIGGPNTGLNIPTGVAVDAKGNVYVANNAGGSIEVFTIPSPTPSPSPTATASATASPSPSPTPSGATPTPSPTPVATATPMDLAPIATIAGAASGIHQPTGLALDTNGNIYVADQRSTICAPAVTYCPAILKFAAGSNGAAVPTHIAGSATLLFAPTDVKVDTLGNIYVADSTASGAGVIYIFASGSSGNVAPTATFKSPGAPVGLGLSP
jgi:hypothetical protein